MRWVGHIALMGQMRHSYKILVLKNEGQRPLGTERRTWKDNIKMDLQYEEYVDMD
jgi:hypothetical protein